MKTTKKLLTVIIIVAISIVALAGCNAKFDETKNISVVTREDGSGTKTAFMEIIGLSDEIPDVSGAIVSTSTAAVLAEVKGNPSAIAFDSLGYVSDEVKTLKVDGVEATIANITSGAYPIARPLNVAYKSETINNNIFAGYLEFLQSTEAQTIISDNGYVSTKQNPISYAPSNAEALSGTIDISGSTSLEPLMIKLAAKFEEIHKNVTVNVGAGGSSQGFKDARDDVSDFGMMSRPFKDTETSEGLQCYQVAKDGIAVIVNKNNTFNNITLEQLMNIYNSEQSEDTKIKTWADLK